MKRHSMKRVKRRPLRLRLTLVYSGLFLLAGVLLLAGSYGLVARSLDSVKPQLDSSDLLPVENNLYKQCVTTALAKSQDTAICKDKARQDARGLAGAGLASQRAQTLSRLLDDSAAALGVTVLLSALLGWIMAGRALRPVHAITAAAQRASETNLAERIALTGPDDELKELADTFDAMLSRLEAAFGSQRRFVANASHELRTPLTVMRTAIDVTLAKPDRTPVQLETMAAEVRQAAERAEALIEALLTLARSDRGQGAPEQLDFAVLAEDALDAATTAIQAAGLTVDTTLLPGPALGDPVLLERLVTNLIDNAIRHNVPDGWIQVGTGIRDGDAFIVVASSGEQIPDEAVPGLFEPFRRLHPKSGDGTGLGLSIVRSVAAAHQGQVIAQPLAGGGLEMTVRQPAGST